MRLKKEADKGIKTTRPKGRDKWHDEPTIDLPQHQPKSDRAAYQERSQGSRFCRKLTSFLRAHVALCCGSTTLVRRWGDGLQGRSFRKRHYPMGSEMVCGLPDQLSAVTGSGVITNNKFCLSRFGRLVLSPDRRPRLPLSQHGHPVGYPPSESPV